MPVYIDPPTWPAHGTRWSHLISDKSLDELHAFAASLKLPKRSFDLDHYDVPADLYSTALERGATAVPPREIVKLLQDSGLRIPAIDREKYIPRARRDFLKKEWQRLGNMLALPASEQWGSLGEEILVRWSEIHRTYHNDEHLEDVLLALDHLEKLGERISPATLLAAWFHDVIYQGVPSQDERDSAAFASVKLQSFSIAPAIIAHAHEAILATDPSRGASPATASHLLDADRSILGAGTARYLRYAENIRREYSQVSDDQFRSGRSTVLTSFLNRDTIFISAPARRLWEARARENILAEIRRLG